MKISSSLLGGALAFLVATTCCWLPWLVVLLGGSLFGATAFSEKLDAFSGPLMILSAGMLSYAGYTFWKKNQRAEMKQAIVLQSVITCPKCGFAKNETMPTDACQFFYQCENCETMLKPKSGDCCVFCSYGTVKCPPIQAGDPCCV